MELAHAQTGSAQCQGLEIERFDLVSFSLYWKKLNNSSPSSSSTFHYMVKGECCYLEINICKLAHQSNLCA